MKEAVTDVQTLHRIRCRSRWIDRAAINPVRQEYFGEARPASTLIGVNELAIPGMKVEIEAIVGLPD